MLDIGANIGNHSLAFSTAAHTVYAFEPVPQIYELLKCNLAHNNINNVRASQVALANCSGEDIIHMVATKNVGASSFDKKSDLHTIPVTVSKDTGDNVLSTLGVRKVDFVKLDVEAHEAFALDGQGHD